MKNFAKTLLLFSIASFALAASAQRQTFTADPGASSVAFSLTGSHSVKGVFHLSSAHIDFDCTAQTISGSVVVGAASGDSGEKSRDAKMNNDVLETGKFAEITFVPRSFTGALATSGDSTIQVSGVFTLHGAAHDLTLPMQVHIENGRLTAKGHFTVPYVQWGLKDPSIFILKVAKEVGIDLTLAGSLSTAN
jgi:polyisoprenoid-binding protein YceI